MSDKIFIFLYLRVGFRYNFIIGEVKDNIKYLYIEYSNII
jgi:hypothetical protein